MDQVLHGKVVQLECGGSMRIEIILWIIVWDEIRLVRERKGGGGCERGSLGDEYGGVEVLGGNWRGYSLTRGGQYAGTGHTLLLTGTVIRSHRALSQMEQRQPRAVHRARGGT